MQSIQQLTAIAPSVPGHIAEVWSAVNHQLYHKLSPYTDYNQGLLSWGSQPFLYSYPDDNHTSFPNTKYDSFSFPIGSSLKDTIRVSKFLTSGNGVLFLAKQLLLQTGQPFNETRIYNPLSPIVAAGRGATLNIIGRPQRNFDTSGGLSGILTSLVGISLNSDINAPSGTTGNSSLPPINVKSDGKGLSRAATANSGLAHLNTKWGVPNSGTGFFSSLFANFLPASQKGIIYKSSEGAYGDMVNDKLNRLSSINKYGVSTPIEQQWIGGGSIMRKQSEYPINAGRLFIDSDNHSAFKKNSELTGLTIVDIGDIGYDVTEHSLSGKQYRYGDSVGVEVDKSYKSSDIMIQYGDYVNPDNKYPSKQDDTSYDTSPASLLNKTLKDVITNLGRTSNGLYTVNIPDDSRILSSGNPTDNGYDRLFNTKQKSDNKSGLNYKLGLLTEYRKTLVHPVDDSISMVEGNSKRLPSAHSFDAINTLSVISGSGTGNSYNDHPTNANGWGKKTPWNPYDHDQIAFYFYDVVNENFIPFRATITGVNENCTAGWDEMAFIGRADKVYSYNGFTRTLSFKFTVNITSIAELAPTWQRINYLMTVIKPSNYTTDTVASNNTHAASTGPNQGTTSTNNIANRFMIPPMMTLTVGDMYKDQPIIITSIGISVPDDASWETLNEENSPDGWSYLANYIKSPNVLYGQLPRTVEINLYMNLLEKEQPIMGGANFGNAPRSNIFNGTSDGKNWNINVPNGKAPNKLNQSFIVNNQS